MSRAATFALPGFLFGAGLAVSGMTNPGKVTGFLDITGDWDPSLALVMAGAMLVYGVGSVFIMKRDEPVLSGTFSRERPSKLDKRLILGSAMFGMGWGLVGFCPGPAVTNLATLRPDVGVFVAAMVAGMLVAQRVLGADR